MFSRYSKNRPVANPVSTGSPASRVRACKARFRLTSLGPTTYPPAVFPPTLGRSGIECPTVGRLAARCPLSPASPTSSLCDLSGNITGSGGGDDARCTRACTRCSSNGHDLHVAADGDALADPHRSTGPSRLSSPWFEDAPEFAYGGEWPAEAIETLLAAHPERGALANQISALDDAVAGDHLESRGKGRHGTCPECGGSGVSTRSNCATPARGGRPSWGDPVLNRYRRAPPRRFPMCADHARARARAAR